MDDKSDQSIIAACKHCIWYLQDNFHSEMGILRCSVSQVEVRALKKCLLEGNTVLERGSVDIYVAAEALQALLRQLRTSVLSEICSDLLSSSSGTKSSNSHVVTVTQTYYDL
jgi:hypothetical protein